MFHLSGDNSRDYIKEQSRLSQDDVTACVWECVCVGTSVGDCGWMCGCGCVGLGVCGSLGVRVRVWVAMGVCVHGRGCVGGFTS